MARIRTIKPEFPQSETMGKVSRDARLLFIMLWTICDDEGRTRAASRMLASLLFPYDDDARALLPEWLIELDKAGCIRVYEVDGQSYLEILNWLKHQKIDRASKSKFPPFDARSRAFAEPSRNVAQDQGREGTVDHGPGGEAEAAPPPARVSDIDAAMELWLPVAYELRIPDPGFANEERRRLLALRLAECGGLDGWKHALDNLRKAEWLRDDTDPSKPKHWVNLASLLKPENFTGLMEGRYAERHHPEKQQSGLTAALAGLAD